MPAPTLPLEGGCLCGALRYRITALPLAVSVCHCTDCQRTSGGSHGMSMLQLKTAVELLKGEPLIYTKRFEDDGRLKHNRFCGSCGGRVWTELSKFPQIVNIKPGTLDDTRWLEPVAHLWTSEKQPWTQIPDGLLSYEKQPADFTPILQAFAAQLAR